MNTQDRYIGWNLLVLKDVQASRFEIFACDLGDCGCRGDIPDINQHRQNHSHFDCHREIGKDGQQQCDQPHYNFQLAEAQQFGNLLPLAHVVRDDEQDCREHGQRNELG